MDLSRRSWIVVALGIAVFAVAGLTWLGIDRTRDHWPDRDAYVTHNERLLATLPLYPGARRFADWENTGGIPGGNDENGPPYKAYETSWVYRFPAGVSCGQVMPFYYRALTRQGWTNAAWTGAARPEHASFFSFVHDFGLVAFTCSHASDQPVDQVEITADYDEECTQLRPKPDCPKIKTD